MLIWNNRKISLLFLTVLIHLNLIHGAFREEDYYDSNEQVQQESMMNNNEIDYLMKQMNDIAIQTTSTLLPTTDPMPPTYSSQDRLMNCKTELECKNLFESIMLNKHSTKNQNNAKKVNFFNSIWGKK
jgi:hypothetical protein